MIVCICANVSEKVIRAEIKKGKTFEEIRDTLNICMGCRICYKDVIKLFNPSASTT